MSQEMEIDVTSMVLIIETPKNNRRSSTKFGRSEIIKAVQSINNANVCLIVFDRNDDDIVITKGQPSEKMRRVIELELAPDDPVEAV